MVVIRLARHGAKKKPYYHVVAIDSRRKREGKCIERLGHFNPCALGQAERLRLEMERVRYWLGVGAQPSDRMKLLIKFYEKNDCQPLFAKDKPPSKKKEKAAA
jgi:small subunit ribosomal protein S16